MATSRKRVSTPKKKIKTWIPVAGILLTAAILLFIAIVTENRASTERVDLEAYYASRNGSVAVMLNEKLSHENFLCENGTVYVSTAYMTSKLNPRFYWDEEEGCLLYSLPMETLRADLSSRYQNQPVLRQEKNTTYVQLGYIARVTNMSWQLIEEPLHVVIRTDFSPRKAVLLSEEAVVREEARVSSPIMTIMEAGSYAFCLAQASDWTYVCTEDGIPGYVQNSSTGGISSITLPDTYEEPTYTMVRTDQHIGLTWHLVSNRDDNGYLESLTQQIVGINVLCPTWFHMTGDESLYTSFADKDYVDQVHAMGIDVWVVIENMENAVFGDAIQVALGPTSARTRLVRAIVDEALDLGADGINVDLENIPSACGTAYVQFIREMSLACHAEGLVLSVDNYVPSAWTAYYDRREQGIFADYVIVMGYDEHYAGSDAGSTASLPFVIKGVEDTLKEVPAAKVINAVPFYTRLWKGSGDTLSSSVVSMWAVEKYLRDYDLSPTWDNELGQSYVEFELDGNKARIWIEDLDSMKARLEALDKYSLAGIAAWRLGNEIDEVWELIDEHR